MSLSTSFARRCTASSLVIGLALMTSSGTILAASPSTPSTLTGRVLAANGADPRPGVVVTLVNPASEQMYKSQPTDQRGAFAIGTAPAGSYELVVEAPEGAFLASNSLQLAPGANRPVSLALKPGKQGQAPPATTPAPTTTTTTTTTTKKKGDLPTWAKWVIAGGIVVGGAIIIDALTSNSNEASSF